MKSFLKPFITIATVVGIVFVITYMNRSAGPDEDANNDQSQGKGLGKKIIPLRFFTREAIKTNSGDPVHIRMWDESIEVGQDASFPFLFKNEHDQPVQVQVAGVNCQCAGADMALISTPLWNEYQQKCALINSPLGGLAQPIEALMNHLAFYDQLKWQEVFKNGAGVVQDVPPASNGNPQFGFLRLKWQGKKEGQQFISASVVSNLPNGNGFQDDVKAQGLVVPGFVIYRKEGDEWKNTNTWDFNELGSFQKTKDTFYCWSLTRRNLVLDVNFTNPAHVGNPCVTMTQPEPASEAEYRSLVEFLREKKLTATDPQSLYKFDVQVAESVVVGEGDDKLTFQLDIGPLVRKMEVRSLGTSTAGSSLQVSVQGQIRGDIRITNGSKDGRIDLGSTTGKTDRTQVVSLIADRPGLDISVVDKEVVPSYLKVKLEPMADVGNRKQWRLSVTLPAGALSGTLRDSHITLKTNDPTPRMIRFPVLAATIGGGL
ncbi:MAG: hypothetical protein R3B84_21890 [Zavarzinella sp.]